MSTGDWTSPIEIYKKNQELHYDVSRQEIAEPISDMKLIPSPANPGGSKTLWVSTVDGALHFGAPAVVTSASAGVISILQTRAEFYGLTTGTGNVGANDYVATVAVKTGAATGRVPFPRDNPSANAGGIVRVDSSSFTLPLVGTYEIHYDVHTTEHGQFNLELNGVDLPWTVSANMNPTVGGHPHVKTVLVTTFLANSVLALVNCTGNSAPLTITAATGGVDTHANSQNLVIRQIA